MEDLIPLVLVWWMALSPVAAFYLLRHVLIDDFPTPGSGPTVDEWAELEADPDWQEYLEYHRQRQERWKNAPVILHVGWTSLLGSATTAVACCEVRILAVRYRVLDREGDGQMVETIADRRRDQICRQCRGEGLSMARRPARSAAMTDTPPKPKRRRWRWLVVVIMAVICGAGWWLWPRRDLRCVGRWSYVPNVQSSPRVVFELNEDGTGSSTVVNGSGTSPLVWNTAGEWIFFDDPTTSLGKRLGHKVERIVVLMTDNDLGGRVDCLKIRRIDKNTMNAMSSHGAATLSRLD